MVSVSDLYYFYYWFSFFSEKFYLVVWPNEDTVSIHLSGDLKEPSREDFRAVGSLYSIQFGRSVYKGKIACIGKF